jgi:hypothetical protein
MLHRRVLSSQYRRSAMRVIGPIGLLTSALVLALTMPARAHTVHTAGDVAATFHLEPHHNPQAGQPAQTWFALSKSGGAQIPLSQCNCKLAVYEGGKLISQPTLKALNVEQYKGIPSAEVTFPKVGIYQLKLTGSPQDGAEFSTFGLSYDVTVQAGSAASPAAALPAKPEPVNAESGGSAWLWWLLPLVLAGGTWGWLKWQKKS